LLYVAMTRAEEALFIAGALKNSETAPHDDSWYARLADIFADAAPVDVPIWGQQWQWGALPPLPPKMAETVALPIAEAKPGWMTRPPAAEPRPAKPLAPSSLGEDMSADAPVMAGADAAILATAARRGVLMHRMLERLPTVPLDDRRDAAIRWLARQAGDLSDAARAEMAAAVLATIADPRWAELFAPDTLAEVPITAKLGTRIIAGTIDRLLVEPTRIRLVDFKTARHVPVGVEAVPSAILRQIAAYAAGLAAIYPDRVIEAALLYTHAPRLIEIPAGILQRHKLALLGEE
jgi:ATP-dependent helicase/nuclease subunit A